MNRTIPPIINLCFLQNFQLPPGTLNCINLKLCFQPSISGKKTGPPVLGVCSLLYFPQVFQLKKTLCIFSRVVLWLTFLRCAPEVFEEKVVCSRNLGLELSSKHGFYLCGMTCGISWSRNFIDLEEIEANSLMGRVTKARRN